MSGFLLAFTALWRLNLSSGRAQITPATWWRYKKSRTMSYKNGIHVSGILVILIYFTFSNAFAKTFYVSTNGLITNSGLSTNAPWSLGKINYNAQFPSNRTIVFLPGIYNETNSANFAVVRSPFLYLRSQVKWGARLINGYDNGINILTNDVTIDGFEICGAFKSGILGAGSNICVRNCWIHDCGTNPASGVGPSGIVNTPFSNQLIENNLIEHIGNTEHSLYDHGVYLAGANVTVRNNVIRYCAGAGIQLNDHSVGGIGSTNVLIYNNLIYGNGRWGMFLSSDWSNSVASTIFNNTVVDNGIAVELYTRLPGVSYLNATNNILMATGQTLAFGYHIGTNPVLNADYNLMARVDNLPLGGHSIVTSNAGFAHPNLGLFWLTSGSPARRAAYAGLYPTNNFFGDQQTNSVDIGAFQYRSSYELDTRVLDPSPGPSTYWLDLTQPRSPSHLQTVPDSEP